MNGRPVTVALGIAILAMLALTVVPGQEDAASAQQAGSAGSGEQGAASGRAYAEALSPLDYIEIQQLVRKSAWAFDSGDNYGYAYADLFTPDGEFVGMNQGPGGRNYRGRDQLATLARGGARGATVQSQFTMNHVITRSGNGATGRAYVVVVDVGVAGKPNRVNHGGSYEDVYEKTALGWRFKQRTYRESKVDTWPGRF
ncbi:MAG TPA: nuclear transport factor 2 family protein [Vicinamibacterales bacterium]|nr:nuclear transport factor 2 family protein [Vicinamibacterales bacterium]